MINVLFLAYHFPPVGGAPVQRSLNFVRYLLNYDYRALVVAGPGKTQEEFTPQDQKLVDQIPPEVPIYRVETKEPLERKGIFHKLQSLLNLPRPFAKWWIPLAIKQGETAHQKDIAKLIYASMSPFESANAASYLSNKIGIPWVADLRDAWILDEIQTYPSVIHRKIRLMMMHRLLSTASVIIMNTPEAEASLKKAFPNFCKKQVLTITNGFDDRDFNKKIAPRNNKKFRIVHVGHFLTNLLQNRRFKEALGGAVPGIDTSTRSPLVLFRALEKLSQESPRVKEDLEIVFVGNISHTERTFVKNSKLSRASRFTGYLPHQEALKIVRTADLLFLPMHNLPPGMRSTSIPSKIYEYMASGRPILAAVPDGDARDFLAECGTAFLCRPEDYGEMTRILNKVYGSWEKGKHIISTNKKFLSRFERKNLTKMLAKEFDKLLLRR